MPWITVSPQISFLVLVHTDWNVHWHSSIMVTTATEQLHNMRLRESRQEVYCDSGPRTKLGHRGVGCTIWHTDQNLLRRTFISWWFFNVYLLRFSTCCCSFVVVIVLSLSLSLSFRILPNVFWIADPRFNALFTSWQFMQHSNWTHQLQLRARTHTFTNANNFLHHPNYPLRISCLSMDGHVRTPTLKPEA